MIRDEFPNLGEDFDDGFRVLKLDDSNMKDVYYSSDEITQHNLLEMLSNIKEDRTSIDLLWKNCVTCFSGNSVKSSHSDIRIRMAITRGLDGMRNW